MWLKTLCKIVSAECCMSRRVIYPRAGTRVEPKATEEAPRGFTRIHQMPQVDPARSPAKPLLSPAKPCKALLSLAKPW